MTYSPKVYTDILKRMTQRVVARSTLTDMEPGGGVHTVLAAVAREQDDVNFQTSEVQKLWDIDKATNEGLDRRGDDYNLTRRQASKATGSGVFSRASGYGTPVTGRTIATGDGLTTSFGATPDSNGYQTSTVVVTWTSASVLKTMTDDGVGSFTGDGNAAGSTVDYVTGALTLDLTGDTPDAAPIQAAFTPRKSAVSIPKGSAVRLDADIQYITTAITVIPAGSTVAPTVAFIAVTSGSESNCDAGAITRMDAVAGVEAFINDTPASGGTERELDPAFRARMKGYVRALSRGTKSALKFAALGVSLDGSGTVVSAEVSEGFGPDRGIVTVFVDDGNGTIEETDDTAGTPESVVTTASGGEKRIQLSNRAIVQDGVQVPVVRWTDSTAGPTIHTLIEGDDYWLDYATGQIALVSGGSAGIPASGLNPGDSVEAEYAWYVGLINAVQRKLSGDPTDYTNYPGYSSGGDYVIVRPPVVYQQLITLNLTLTQGYTKEQVHPVVKAAVSRYINSLGINGDVLVSGLITAAKNVAGVFDVTVDSPAQNTILGDGELARVKLANITIQGN